MSHFESTIETNPILSSSGPERMIHTHDLRAFDRIIKRFGDNPEDLYQALVSHEFYSYLGEANREHEEEYGEAYEHFRTGLLHIAETLDEQGEEAGDHGTTNEFRVLPPNRVYEDISPSIAQYIGERRIKQTLLTAPNGQTYRGIPKTPDSPNPVEAFRNGMMMFAYGHMVKKAFPQPFFFIEEVGARDIRTGEIIPGLEQEVVGMRAFMEAIHGPSLAKLVDIDERFWTNRLSARFENVLRAFLTSDPGYTRESIKRNIQKWPGLLDINWTVMPDIYEAQTRFLGSMKGGLRLHHGDAHFGNVMLPFRTNGTHDNRSFVRIDPDFTVLSADPDFGLRLEDYRHPYKSTPEKIHLLLPDRLREDVDLSIFDNKKPMDSVTHIRAVLEVVGTHMEAIKQDISFMNEMQPLRQVS
jgi:hypothetical protein